MIKKHGNRFAPEKKTGNHKWIPLLLLFLLMLLSSCAAGYILGRSAFPESSGRRIDTILLTPDGDAAEQQMQQIFHLAGKINYTNGRPYAQGRVQLHSEPRETVTDTNGSFTFFHLEGGEHQIRILDRTGNVLGERKVNLFSAQAESGVNVSLQQNGQYTIEVAVDVRLMEVAIELDEKNNSLYINPEKLTYLTSDGRLVTPTGEAYYWEGTLVTPGGLVITADKTVVAPASEGPLGIALLTPENQVIYPEQDAALPDGTKLLENGNILLPGETMIERNENGTVILTPDGLRGQPGAGGVVISGDNQVSPIGTGTSGPDSNTQDNPAGPNESVSGNGYDTGTNPAERNDSSQIGNGSGGVNAGLGSGEGGESNAGSGSVSGDSSGDSSEGNDKDGGGISGGGGSGDSSGGNSGDSSGGNSGNSGGETGGDNGGGGDDKDEGPIPNFRVSWTQGQEIELFSICREMCRPFCRARKEATRLYLKIIIPFMLSLPYQLRKTAYTFPCVSVLLHIKTESRLPIGGIHKTAALRKVIPYAWVQVKANPIFWSGSGLMRAERTGLTQMQARQTLIIGSGLKYGLSRKVRRYMHGKRTVL